MESRSISSNFMWRLFERFLAQGVSLVISIVLARILDADAYGAVAIVTVFTSFFAMFLDGGFSAALIQKKNADDLDFSSVFYFNLVICFILYIGMFIFAPAISSFYTKPILKPVIRVQSLTLIISGFKGIQTTYVSKNMQFKKFFFSTLGGTITAAFVGIWMALKGYGIWALVIQGLVNNFIDTVILWITVKWRPKLIFSFKRIRQLFSYGSKLLVSNIIYNSYSDLRQLIIGKKYTSSDLAYFNKAYQFPFLIYENTFNALNSVLFPSMAYNQDDLSLIKNLIKKTIQISSYCISPLMFGLAAVAHPFIYIILGKKWLFCVPYLIIFSLSNGIGAGIGAANQNALKAIGKSGKLLYIEIIKTLIDFIILFISMNFGPFAIAVGMVIGSFFRTYICALPASKCFGYPFLEQVKDMIPNLLINTVMAVFVFGVSFIPLSEFIIFPIQIFTGIIIYLIISKVSNNKSYNMVLHLIKSYWNKRQRNEK